MPPSLDLSALREAYHAGADPRAVVQSCLQRLQELDDPGIFIALSDAKALDAAVAALGPFDPVAKPLWGVPFAVKDNIDLAGLSTTAACPAFAYRPTESATAVARLVAAGAIPVGKANLDQFATGLVGVRTPYPVPRNSFDPAMVPGGSSSGSAVAVAQGIASFSLGTDTAGSGRVPAGLNNLVGLKPSLGLVPVRGVLPACQTLDCLSIFALTVPDAWTVLEVIAGYDPLDPWSRRIALEKPSRPIDLRIGVPHGASRIFLGDALAERAFDQAVETLTGLGPQVFDVDLEPFFAVAMLLYEGAWVAERYQALRAFIEVSPDAMHPTTLAIIKGAERYSAADAFAGLYRLADLRRRTEAIWDRVDMLAVPTYPKPVTRAALDADPIGSNSALGTYTNFVNLLDLCALAVPGPFREDGFPSGMTLIGRSGHDRRLAALGAEVHRAAATPLGATGRPQPDGEEPIVVQQEDRIELAVVGAHLSGMPLNPELTRLGATLLRKTETRPLYRFYALAGGPPRRPGLVRVGEGEGYAIAVEVWALRSDAFGRFVAQIPAPLGVGTLLLADGTTPKGFLCEAVALAGAAEISRFGGWRAFCAAPESAEMR